MLAERGIDVCFDAREDTPPVAQIVIDQLRADAVNVDVVTGAAAALAS